MVVCLLFAFFSGCASLDPLPQASVDNDIKKIKNLVDQGTNVNGIYKITSLRPDLYYTALWIAVDNRNNEAVKTLLELGADPNIHSSYYGNTQSGWYRFKGSPLMAAVLEEDVAIVEMLLKADADPNAIAKESAIESSSCMDPLGYGALKGNVDIATALLNYGADVNIKYPNKYKAAYEAMARGYLDYAVLLIEKGLEIESDPEYMHYNAELAHLAADFYAQTNEEKSLQFYKKAIELYPEAAKNYESIAEGKWAKEFGKGMLAAAGTAFNHYAATQGVNTAGSIIGPKYSLYRVHNYDPNLTEEEYYRQKAIQSRVSQTSCHEIVSCYEENKPDVALVDCVKSTYEKEGKKLSSK